MKGWRTLIVAMGVAALGVAQQADWATLVPPQDAGYALTGIAALMAVLRLITSSPVGGKQ